MFPTQTKKNTFHNLSAVYLDYPQSAPGPSLSAGIAACGWTLRGQATYFHGFRISFQYLTNGFTNVLPIFPMCSNCLPIFSHRFPIVSPDLPMVFHGCTQFFTGFLSPLQGLQGWQPAMGNLNWLGRWLKLPWPKYWLVRFNNNSGYNTNNSGYIWVIWWDKLSSGWWCNVPILKNMSSSVGKDDIPYIMESKKYVKPPTS